MKTTDSQPKKPHSILGSLKMSSAAEVTGSVVRHCCAPRQQADSKQRTREADENRSNDRGGLKQRPTRVKRSQTRQHTGSRRVSRR